MTPEIKHYIENHIEEIDTNLDMFFYELGYNLVERGVIEVINILAKSGIPTLPHRYYALHNYLTTAFDFFHSRHITKKSLSIWIGNEVPSLMGFSMEEVQQYVLLHQDDWKDYVVIKPDIKIKNSYIIVRP